MGTLIRVKKVPSNSEKEVLVDKLTTRTTVVISR